MKYTYTIIMVLLLAVLGLSLTVNAQEDQDLEPGLAVYTGPLDASLRAESNRDADRVGSVPPFSTVTILEVGEDRWVRVQYDDLEGWLRTSELVNVTEDDLIDPDDPLLPPTGSYQVGQVYLHWVDESRDEVNTDDPDDHRELIISIWYPAEVPEGTERGIYWEALSGPGLEAWQDHWGVPQQVMEEFAQLKSRAYRDVPLAENGSPFPVLLMSHGFGDRIEGSTNLAVELASHGYVVVGMQHPYIAGVTVFPDERIVRVNRDSFLGEGIELGVPDMLFVLNQLESLNPDAPEGMFIDHLDLDRVGALGHSYGGIISIMAASTDDRIRAALTEDGGDPDRLPQIEQPSLYFTPFNLVYESAGPSYTVVVNDFEHGSFLDVMSGGFMRGLILPVRSAQIVHSYVLAFFDQYLKDIDQPLLDGPSNDFPEVRFESRNTE